MRLTKEQSATRQRLIELAVLDAERWAEDLAGSVSNEYTDNKPTWNRVSKAFARRKFSKVVNVPRIGPMRTEYWKIHKCWDDFERKWWGLGLNVRELELVTCSDTADRASVPVAKFVGEGWVDKAKVWYQSQRASLVVKTAREWGWCSKEIFDSLLRNDVGEDCDMDGALGSVWAYVK